MALHSQPEEGVFGLQRGGYNKPRFWQLYLRPAPTSSSWMLSFPIAKWLSILNNCAYSLSFFLDYCTKPLWWPSLDMTMFLIKTAFTFTVSRHSLAHTACKCSAFKQMEQRKYMLRLKCHYIWPAPYCPCPCHCFLSFLKGGNCKVNFPPVTTTH